ncbi:MAG: DinB family protein [Cyclobacteriaceae bacterium]|nr:DinB family protein [Cyclobacteriaceae bacterium]
MDNQPNLFNEILIRQFMPAFKMIEKVIESCSKTIWAQRNIDPPIWQQVYHVLYGIDYWFSESKESFVPPEFNEDVNSVLGEESKGFIEQEDMIGYLRHVEDKTGYFISNLTESEFTAPSKHYHKWTNLDVIIEQVRHLQHHLGYLNRVLLKCKIKPVEWEFYEEG